MMEETRLFLEGGAVSQQSLETFHLSVEERQKEELGRGSGRCVCVVGG